MDKKIVLVRLTTGEELLTTHVNTDSDTFEFHNTILLVTAPPSGPGPGMNIAFAPWMPYTSAKDRVYINKNSVMFMVDPAPPLVNEYQKATGSIVTPRKGLIIPQ
jgi:hypothetical protein